jgi:predicted dehydrogenase
VKQVLQHVRSGRLEVAEVPEPACRAGGIVVRNACSLISAGTERMVVEFAGKSLIGKARERPDLVKQALDKAMKDGLIPTVRAVLTRLDQPIALGYSCAGRVVEVGRGAEEFAVGDRVACAGMGYASHADVVFVPRNLAVPIPETISFEDASYVTLGAIALQGVRIADVRLGERVAVLGLGLLGQLAVQILRAGGCQVIGVDLDPAKVALARTLGADAAVVRSDDVAAAVAAFTGGSGVDAVIVAAATESNDPTELAGEICRDRGRVCVIGAVRMDVPRKAYYEKELELRLSRSYGPGRYDPEYEEHGRDYPIGYVRWTERRNMEEFLRLVAAGYVTPGRLTTHRFSIAEADRAYDLIMRESGDAFAGVVLTYPAAAPTAAARTHAIKPHRAVPGKVGVGFIGAGNFARAVLLPVFARTDGVTLVGIATASAMTSKAAGQKFGFSYCTTEAAKVIEDETVDAVVIATRHGSHARLAADALRAGKAVFVEKPLALDEEGLQSVLVAQAESGGVLSVGFNRRFSPLAAELKAAMLVGGPLAMTYRINAGPVPRESWIHDPEDGGGRIIGEVCHFVDLAQYLTDDVPAEVFAARLAGSEGAVRDTLSVVLRFPGGSVASLNYFANGDRSFPKERLEVFGDGRIAILDDFRTLMLSRNGRRSRRRRWFQDKGYKQEIIAFVRAVREGGELPIPLRSLIAATRATFAMEESLRTGLPCPVSLE